MAARKYTSAESTGTSSTTSTSDQTKVTLTFTPDANSTYAYIWSCQALGDANYDVRVKLKNNAGTAICSGNHQNNTTNDFIPYSGFAIETFGSSPTSQSITLTYSSEGVGITASIKNARIVALKLTSADVYSENTGTSTSSNTLAFTAATTASFTPASAGFYAVLGYCEHNAGGNGGAGRYRVTINDALSYNSAELVSLVTDYIPNMSVNYSTSLSGSCNIKYEFNSYGGSTVSCRNSKILALRMDEFDYSNVGINNSNNTTTTSTTYVTAETTGNLSLEKYSYLILGCTHYATTSASIQAHYRWQTDGVTWAESDITNTTLGYGTGRAVSRHTGVYVRSSTIANSQTDVQYRRDGATTTTLYNTTLLYLALEPIVNNKGRKYHSAASTAESTTTSTAEQTKVTLTFTPDANSTYAYLYFADVGSTNSIALDVIVRLNDNAANILSQSNFESTDLTDYATVSGIAFQTFGASPTSQNITLTYASETASTTSKIRNARVLAIKLTSADSYVENTTDQTTTSATLQTATTLTFTPSSIGSYLILGSMEAASTTSATVVVKSQITHSGTAYSVVEDQQLNDLTNYVSGMMQASVGSLAASSQSVTLQWASGTAGNTVRCRRARLLALRLDEFASSNITTDNTRTTTSGTSYSTKTTTGAINVVKDLSYLVIGSASVDNNSNSLSSGFRWLVTSDSAISYAESLMESATAGNVAASRFSFFTIVNNSTAATTTARLDYFAESGATAAGADDVTISVLLLDPEQLYWVGGNGTWDSSTTTNWALSSGGSGSVAAPKAGTSIVFDSASDSGTGFTATVSTGAVCKNLTASGLDQTMTLSGSAAMSVYGNFSVPSINFTQSYTGTISFRSTSSQTITTNGKSFTAFTFNGVGGTWTLQDAATITGVATLTNGTLALGSYAFTCDTFDSNNANARTINFGTGKIVVTDEATATVWNTSTVTNLTISGTPLIELTGGGATTKTVTLGALSEANSISVTLNTTAGTVALSGSARDLIIGNNIFTLSNAARTIYGSLTINGTNPTLAAGTGTLTFGATSGTKTITTNGVTLDFPITINGAGGTFQLGDDLTVGTSTSRAFVLTNGILELNGKNFNLYGSFALSQGLFSPNRQLLNTPGGTNAIVLSIVASSSTQVWNSNDLRSYYTDGKVNVKITGAGLYYPGRTADGITYVDTLVNWQISSTSGAVFMGDATNGISVRNFTIDNNAVNVTFYGAVFKGNYTVAGTNPTITYSGTTWTWAATSGIQTINLNGHASNTINTAITVNGAGGTLQLQHSLNVGTSTSRTVTLQSGTLDLNGYTLTIFGVFSNSTTSVRTLAFGSTGKIVLTTTSGSSLTICNTATETNLTVTGTNPLIQVTGSGVGPLNITGTSNLINLQLSPSAAATFAVTLNVKDLIIDNSANITLNNSVRSIYGNLTISGTNPTIVAGTSITTFAATSGTQTITTNGKTLDFPITFNGVGGTWALVDDLTIGTTTSRAVTLTNGTFDLNNKKITIYGTFVSSGTAARRIQNTDGNQSISTNIIDLDLDTAATVWSFATATGFTTDGNVLVAVTGGGGATTKTVSHGNLAGATESNVVNLIVAGGIAGTVTINGSWKNLTFANSTYTISNTALTIYGDVYFFGTTPTLTAGANAWTFSATSGIKTITSNGEIFDFPITFNGVGGTWSLSDNLTVGSAANRTVTLTNGTIDLNSKIFTIFGPFSSNNSNTRRLQNTGGTGTFSHTLNGGTPWDTGTVTGLTTDGNVLVTIASSGNNGVSLDMGALNEANAISVTINSSFTPNVSPTSGNTFKNLILTSCGQLGPNAITVYGNYTTTVMSYNGTNTPITFAGSGTQLITTNSIAVNRAITFDGTGTFRLGDALTMGNRTPTLNQGTLDFNNFNFTAPGGFKVTGSGAKVLAQGTGNLIISSSGASAFDATGSNLTSTGTGKIDMTSSSAKTFVGGSNSYNTLNQGGSGNLSITGNNTFKNITNTTNGTSVLFADGSTNTFTQAFSLSGTSGNLITIGSSSGISNHTLTKTFGTDVDVNFCSISRSTVDTTGWYALTSNGNVDGGNNVNWLFAAIIAALTGNMFMMFN